MLPHDSRGAVDPLSLIMYHMWEKGPFIRRCPPLACSDATSCAVHAILGRSAGERRYTTPSKNNEAVQGSKAWARLPTSSKRCGLPAEIAGQSQHDIPNPFVHLPATAVPKGWRTVNIQQPWTVSLSESRCQREHPLIRHLIRGGRAQLRRLHSCRQIITTMRIPPLCQARISRLPAFPTASLRAAPCASLHPGNQKTMSHTPIRITEATSTSALMRRQMAAMPARRSDAAISTLIPSLPTVRLSCCQC